MADDFSEEDVEYGGVRVAPIKSTLLVDFNEKVVMIRLNWVVGLLLAVGLLGLEKVIENLAKPGSNSRLWFSFPLFFIGAYLLEWIFIKSKEKQLRSRSIPFEQFLKVRSESYRNSTGSHTASRGRGDSGVGS